MSVEVRVPESGESVREVQIGEWKKSEGDYVRRDEPIVEIETDKAAMDIPAPVDGRLAIRKRQGEIVGVGEILAVIDETAARPTEQPKKQEAPVGGDRQDAAPAPPTVTSDAKVMPAARRAIAQAGVESAQIAPSGPGGRILKEDVQRQQAQPASTELRPEKPLAVAGPRQEEAVPMSMLRRRVAQRLVEAQQTAAMLTTFNEVDMSAVNTLRKEYNDAFEKKYGIKVGLMSFFVKAAVDALKLYPQINAEIRGNDIVYRNYYDVGVAVSSDRGLVVPVLRNAELMSFAQVEQAIADLARRAREARLALEELEGGTFTITNGGVFGSLLSTPILNPPQSGILGLHAIQDRPVVRDGQIVARPMMYIALTYDHRIVDGREAVSFLRRIKECVEAPARMLLEA